MSKRVIFLADSISTQRAGIHYYGIQLIQKIISAYPDHVFSLIASARIEAFDFEQHIMPINSRMPQHLRIRQMTTIPKKVKLLNPDIAIELAHFGPFGLPETIKKVTVIHDLSPITHPQYHGLPSQLVQKASLPKIVANADHIITNSNFTKTEIIRAYRKKPAAIDVVYPDIELAQAPVPYDVISSRYNISKPYFFVSGTLEPRKNHLTILRAFEIFYKSHKSHQLVITGQSGWKNKSFTKALRTSPAIEGIILTGYITRTDLWSLYNNALVFISASHFEGFGLPIIEAMAAGLPLIIADNSAQREVVDDAALLFDSSDCHQLARHMQDLSGDHEKREQLSQMSTARLELIRAQSFNLGYL